MENLVEREAIAVTNDEVMRRVKGSQFFSELWIHRIDHISRTTPTRCIVENFAVGICRQKIKWTQGVPHRELQRVVIRVGNGRKQRVASEISSTRTAGNDSL